MTADSENAALPPPPVAAEQPKSSLERLIGALFSPDDTFRDIARKPDILVPLLLLLVLTIVSSVLIVPHLDVASSVREKIATSNPNLAPEDVERSVRMASAVSKVIAYASPLLALGFWALVAGVLLLSFRLFGADGTYKQSFSVTLYAWIPLVLNSILASILAIFRGTVDPQEMATVVLSNPAFLVSFKDHPILFSLLSSFDLFTIWTVILLAIGFAWVSRTSKARAAAVVVGWWAFLIFMKLGFAAIGAAKVKAS